jgi:ABC-2 type transport system ATP-binding protein
MASHNSSALASLPPGLPRPTTALDYVIEARGLRKHYGPTVAVAEADILVEKGSVFGVLGPNGSGKSTTVRMLLGLIRPDAGEVKLFGQPLREHAPDLLGRVGAVVETPAFIPYLSGRDNLRLADQYTPGAGRAAIEQALERVHLDESAGRKFKTYSLGMKQRLGIAVAILHNPELIILDEPTNGLDPQGTREVRELIPELAAEGRTIVLCSHLLHEVEQVCDSVAIFQRGRIITQGRTSAIIGGAAELEVRLPEIDAAELALRESPWRDAFRRQDGALFIVAPANDGHRVNRFLADRGLYADVLRPVQQSLEEAFFELTGEHNSQ